MYSVLLIYSNNNELKTQLNYRIHKLIPTIVSAGILYKFTVRRSVTLPVMGIDVSANYSMVAILTPGGDIYRKPFKVNHDAAGFDYLLNQIKKVEEEFSMKPPLFMESTGIYHLTLFHFLKNNELEAYVINPLVTNSNKNSGIRKVKNDRLDAISIATLAKFQNIKMSEIFDIAIFAIRTL